MFKSPEKQAEIREKIDCYWEQETARQIGDLQVLIEMENRKKIADNFLKQHPRRK